MRNRSHLAPETPRVWRRRSLLRAGATLAAAGGLPALGLAGCAAPGAPPQTSGKGGKAPVALTWWMADYNGLTAKWLQSSFYPALKQKYPHIQLTVTNIPWGPTFSEKIISAVAASNLPDLCQSGAEFVADWALLKIARPIDEYLKGWSGSTQYSQTAWNAVTWEGKRYGVPARVDARATLVRTDDFAAAHVPMNIPASWTWSDLRALSTSLTLRKGSSVQQFGYNISWSYQNFIAALWQNGGELLDPKTHLPTFASSAGVAALTWWIDTLNAIAPPGTQMTPSNSTVPVFATGKVAMEYAGDGDVAAVAEYAPKKLSSVRVLPPPRQVKQVINEFYNWFCVTTQTKYPDEAWQVLSFFNEPQNLLGYNKTLTSMPPLKKPSGAAYSAYLKDPSYKMQDFLSILGKYGRTEPIIPNFFACRDAITPEFQAAFLKQKTPAQALQAASAKWTKLIQQRLQG